LVDRQGRFVRRESGEMIALFRAGEVFHDQTEPGLGGIEGRVHTLRRAHVDRVRQVAIEVPLGDVRGATETGEPRRFVARGELAHDRRRSAGGVAPRQVKTRVATGLTRADVTTELASLESRVTGDPGRFENGAHPFGLDGLGITADSEMVGKRMVRR